MRSRGVLLDQVAAVAGVVRPELDVGRIVGSGYVELFDERGRLKHRADFENLITDTGDEFYAKRGASAAVNTPTGMRLGTGSTAPSKNGAGAALGAYLATSRKAVDGGFPTVATLGAGLGWRITWKTSWAAGEATGNGIAEVVLTNETPLTDVAGVAANSIARALLSPTVNKGASDTLAVTWFHDLLGA